MPKPTQPRAAKGGRSMLQAQIYLIVIVVLSVPAMAITQLWAIAATQIGAGCHSNDGDNIVFGIDSCTVEGQHFAMLQPAIALVSAAAGALVTLLIVVLNNRIRMGWVWLGLPLAAGVYLAGPYIATCLHGICQRDN
ncbi:MULTISPECIES: hypothetical protein [Mycobacterium ulcerans group]|uniref:hypothetical protein n=1 Tax=Mycobacterium ulcerans group TaxID=2993898 RepID=UPI001CB701B9|nr:MULTISPECIES: hypothetical protein [Mycobacterium ulcerans group]UZK92610.1 hypothetical protein OIO89_00465 [Mycobacterium ulcerans]